MTEVQELERKLAEAKKREAQKETSRRVTEAILQFEGKCFGSRQFNKASRAGYETAYYFEKIEQPTANDFVLVTVWTVTRNRNRNTGARGNTYHNLQYSRSRIVEEHSPGQIGTILSQRSGWTKQEIPLEKFMALFNAGDAADAAIKAAFETELIDVITPTISRHG